MRRPCFVSSARGASPFISSINQRQHHFVHNALPLPQHGVANSFSSAMSTLPTLLTSVKVFDGSEITDAVVVSDTYWSTLSSKLPYLLLSQLLAAVTFVAIGTLITAQGKFVLDQVSSKLEDGSQKKKSNNTTFRKANDPPSPTTTVDFSKLFLCICIDILGSANEAIPLVGELVDVIYAPIAALLLRQLFAGSNIVFLLEFTEEILPFTDILPLATICWVVESFFGSGSLARALRIGEFAPNNREEQRDYIDVVTTKVKENGLDRANERPKLLESNDKKNTKR